MDDAVRTLTNLGNKDAHESQFILSYKPLGPRHYVDYGHITRHCAIITPAALV